jgi:two-component system sensor histidine kinase RegB
MWRFVAPSLADALPQAMSVDAPTAVPAPPLRGAGVTFGPDAGQHSAPQQPDRTDPPALQQDAALPQCLRQLVDLRSVAIACQAVAVAGAVLLGVSLAVAPMAIIISALLALNIVTSVRLRRGAPVTHGAVAAQLALDLAAFTGLLLYAGGSANPVVSIYLLHVVVIAMLLPWRSALAGTALVIACLALAVRYSEPLRHTNGQPLSEAALAGGLWVSFALTAAVTAWFVSRIVASLREHDRLLQDSARKALNDEAVNRLGTLAAGAAHELGTPLTTIAMIAGEMHRAAETPAQRRDAAILGAQVEACRQALSNLRAAAGHARAEGGGPEQLDAFVMSVVARFRALRPDVPLQADWDGPLPAPAIFADQSLRQSLLILLNNAADASPHCVDVTTRWDAHSLSMTVADRGSGVAPNCIDMLGRRFFTTKAPGQGTGLGLVLTASTVNRLGGTVRWSNRADGGLRAEIRLPLDRLLLSTLST